MRLVFDTFAIIAHLRREPGRNEVDQLIRETLAGEHDAYMSIINVGELFYMLHRKAGVAAAERSVRFVHRAGIQVESATDERVMSAATIKATSALSYADAFAASLAQEMEASLVTGDPEYSAVEDRVDVIWLPRDS